ncbi:hypothetical protein F0562_033910 [Nyssa sinensis]|uniref:Uncharacterized protein n=1 Tax=Nyssa sinensis TaxID=561372 RepID=A0A5J5AJE8_9ASTE|nr:hypothetical protein F0562_033910 [Nyssa sinensis]
MEMQVEECNAVSTGEELLEDVPITDTAARENSLKGRKMEVNYVKKPEKVKANTASRGTSKVSSAAQKLKVERASNVKGKQGAKTLHSEEVDVSGFVAFNEDYHSPKHHPPKNN